MIMLARHQIQVVKALAYIILVESTIAPSAAVAGPVP